MKANLKNELKDNALTLICMILLIGAIVWGIVEKRSESICKEQEEDNYNKYEIGVCKSNGTVKIVPFGVIPPLSDCAMGSGEYLHSEAITKWLKTENLSWSDE